MEDKELFCLLIRLGKGEKEALEKIYTNLSSPLYTVIIRITRNKEDAEDVLQELFVKLFCQPPEPDIRKPRAYLFQMARNMALDCLRKRRPTDDIENMEDISVGERDISIGLELRDALEKLSAEERQLISLHINGGLKFREIAEIMKMPLGTALWKYHKGLDKLRAYLRS